MLTIAELVRRIVGIERFLIGTERGRHVLEIDADARPRVESPAHRVYEHVAGFEMGACVGMSRTPPLETGQRVLFPARAGNLDERMLWRTSPRRRDPRSFARLLAIV